SRISRVVPADVFCVFNHTPFARAMIPAIACRVETQQAGSLVAVSQFIGFRFNRCRVARSFQEPPTRAKISSCLTWIRSENRFGSWLGSKVLWCQLEQNGGIQLASEFNSC